MNHVDFGLLAFKTLCVMKWFGEAGLVAIFLLRFKPTRKLLKKIFGEEVMF